MNKLRNWLYNHLVMNNENIKKEYQENNIHYEDQHKKHRIKSWIWLIGLNIKYKILKIKPNPSPEPIVKYVTDTKYINKTVVKTEKSDAKQEFISNAYLGRESGIYPVAKEVHLVKGFLNYDYIVVNLLDTMIYNSVNDMNTIYYIVGKRLNIPSFSEIRKRGELDARNKAKIKKRSNDITIYDIYKEIQKNIGINYEKGVDTEFSVIMQCINVNEYIKTLFDMLIYNKKKIIVLEDTVFTSCQVRKILDEMGYRGITDIILNNECGNSIDEGSMFPYIKEKLNSNNILYIDHNHNNIDFAKKSGLSVWEYYNVYERGKKYRVKNLSSIVGSAYNSIVNQQLYCGHNQYSNRRELGFTYFGIFTIAYVNWIKKQCKNNEISSLFFLNGTGTILKELYQDDEFNQINIDTIIFSEEIAVRCLVDINPNCYIEYYINRRLSQDNSVAFYMEKMGIGMLNKTLSKFGLCSSNIVKKNNEVYWALLEFINSNLNNIKSIYKREVLGIRRYLETYKLYKENIAVVDIRGRGYISMALDWILNSVMKRECKITEFSAIQTIKMTDSCYMNNQLKTFLFSKQGELSGYVLPINISDANFIESVFSDQSPRLCKIEADDSQGYRFEFSDAYPWRYGAINEIQIGIKDFYYRYKSICCEKCFLDIDSDDIARVLKNIMVHKDYIKNNIPLILV